MFFGVVLVYFCFKQKENERESTGLGRKTAFIPCFYGNSLQHNSIETYRYECNQSQEIWRNQDCDTNVIVICIEDRDKTMETKGTEIMKGNKNVEKSTFMWNT